MKKAKLLGLLLIPCILFVCGITLTACGKGGGSVTPTTLAAPTGLNIGADNKLTWNAVANATGYKVNIVDTDYDASGCEYSLSGLTGAGLYDIKVKAIGNDTSFLSSDYAETQHIVGSSGLTYTAVGGTHATVKRANDLITGDVYIAKYHDTLPVTEIAANAFYNSTPPYTPIAIKSVTMPASIKTIGTNAFDNCTSLENVTFANGSQLETIGNYAFSMCSKLESIVIPSGMETIGNHAFESCTKLESVTFASGSQLETIGDGAFVSCGLKSIVIPAGVKTLYYAFSGCTSLESVTFASGSQLETIDYQTFRSCTKLVSIVIPASVTTIGAQAFDFVPTSIVVYYGGVPEDGFLWYQRYTINVEDDYNDSIMYADAYYYSAGEPSNDEYEGEYVWWYWDSNGMPAIW